MSTYLFLDKRILNGARLYLAQSRLRHGTVSGDSLAVWFPSSASREAFEAFVMTLAGGETAIRLLEDGIWSDLPRREYRDEDLYRSLGVAVTMEAPETAAAESAPRAKPVRRPGRANSEA